MGQRNVRAEKMVAGMKSEYITHAARSRFFLTPYFLYLFLERGEGKEKETERNINV